MQKLTICSLAVLIISAAFHSGGAEAADARLRLDLGIVNPIGPVQDGEQGPLPPSKTCAKKDHKCIQDFVDHCVSGGGKLGGAGNPDGSTHVTCSH